MSLESKTALQGCSIEETIPSMKKLTGAQIVIESLMAEGEDIVFGYPGGAILPTYDALLDSKIRHIGTPRARRGAHGRRVRSRYRKSGRGVGNFGSRSLEYRHRNCRRIHGFHAACGNYRTGVYESYW